MDKKQLIISVGREFGSGGHVIARLLADAYNVPLYDHKLMCEIAAEKGVDVKILDKYDEIPRSTLFSRTVRGYNNSPEENIAIMQFNFLKKKASEGESFVVIGRCSETILKEYEGLVSIFILGDMNTKIKRTADRNNISESAAELMINQNDKKRKAYHNYYCTGKWGDSRNYDISINSSRLGIEKTAEMLKSYIDAIQETR